jgi:MFS family permease
MTANTALTVAAGSTIIGFGCGIIFVSYAGIQELQPNKYRGAGIGFTEVCMTSPWGVAGLLTATSLNTNTAAGWRWCYYLGLIFGLLSMTGTILFYFPPTRPQHDFEKTRWQEFKEIDIIGCLIYTAGLTIPLVGLTWAGQPAHPWKSASTLGPIIVGFATFGCLLRLRLHSPPRNRIRRRHGLLLYARPPPLRLHIHVHQRPHRNRHHRSPQ